MTSFKCVIEAYRFIVIGPFIVYFSNKVLSVNVQQQVSFCGSESNLRSVDVSTIHAQYNTLLTYSIIRFTMIEISILKNSSLLIFLSSVVSENNDGRGVQHRYQNQLCIGIVRDNNNIFFIYQAIATNEELRYLAYKCPF